MHVTGSSNFYLTAIAQRLRAHLQQNAMQTLGDLGIFHCYRPQALRQVPLHQPGLVLVVSGVKQVYKEQQAEPYQAGQLLLFAAGSRIHLKNLPAPGSDYLALAATFSPVLLDRFVANYGSQLDLWSQPPLAKATAATELLQSLEQWLDICLSARQSPLQHDHRAQEILLLLAQQGVAGKIFAQQNPSWQQKVSACLALDISRDWRMEEVAARFHCSGATLRRRLDQEHCNFRTLLEEVRLVAALGLLQESYWPVVRVAQAVGYESASRFAERFRLRFGMSPQELRLTRQQVPGLDGKGVSVKGEHVSELGEIHP